MFAPSSFCLFIGLLLNIFTFSQAVCKLNIQKHLNPAKEPLILGADVNGNKVIIMPEVEKKEGVINIADGKKVLLACIGRGNVNQETNLSTSKLACVRGTFKLEGTVVPESELDNATSCKKTYACSTAKVTDKRCGSGGTTGKEIELGFELDDSTWIPQIIICHNVTEIYTLYSSHTVRGPSLDGAIKSNTRKSFCFGSASLYCDGPNRVNPEKCLSEKEQNTTLDKILGPGAKDKYIQEKKVYFAKGHLAPDADFIYNSQQMLTYNFANTAPQWQPFNNGNWRKVENTVRTLAASNKLILQVFTGTYGITTLERVDRTKHENISFYSNKDKKYLNAPELFWKLVRDPNTKKCVVAVGVNNVYLTTRPTTTLCTAVTVPGWPNLPELSKGYTYYCTYKTFKKEVPYIPVVDCSGGLLEGA